MIYIYIYIYGHDLFTITLTLEFQKDESAQNEHLCFLTHSRDLGAIPPQK